MTLDNGYPPVPENVTPMQRIKLYCSWCVGLDDKASLCEVKVCPLWGCRTGRGPHKKRTAKQLAHDAKVSESLLVYHQKRGEKATNPRKGTQTRTQA